MDPRELHRQIKTIRKMRSWWDHVYEREPGPSGRWYPVKFVRMGKEAGTIVIVDILWLQPTTTKVVAIEDVRLYNPDERVRIRPPRRAVRGGIRVRPPSRAHRGRRRHPRRR